MNKQQLASTIWQSANQMRSKIEANEYKDYILGIMFYKYLSEREIQFLKEEGYKEEDVKKINDEDIHDLVNPKRTIRSWNLPFQNRRAIDIQF